MLDVCLEVSGFAAHVVERGMLDSALSWRRRSPIATEARAEVVSWEAAPCDAVRAALDAALPSMSADESRALWLVDVCGCRYAQVAAEMGLDRDEVARVVATARRRVRFELG